MREASELRALSKNDLVKEVRRLEHLLDDAQKDFEDELLIESAVRLDLTPYVKLMWGKQRGTVTTDEARDHAMKVLAASEAAESDAALVRFLTEKLELNEQMAGMMLGDLRELRNAPRTASYREEPSGKQSDTDPERTDDQGADAAGDGGGA